MQDKRVIYTPIGVGEEVGVVSGNAQKRLESLGASRDNSKEKGRSYLRAVANDLSEDCGDLLLQLLGSDAPLESALEMLARSFKQRSYRPFGAKTQSVLLLCCYIFDSLQELNDKQFRAWAKGVDFSHTEISALISWFRELKAWEPLAPHEAALLVVLDRAVVRSARVAAEKLLPSDFIQWCLRNREEFADADTLREDFDRIKELSEESDSKVLRTQEGSEFFHLAQRILLEVGFRSGRSGLNAVRRQIGCPPAPRRKAADPIGAQYTRAVYELCDEYRKLCSAEREAVKALLATIDKHGDCGKPYSE